MSLDACDRSPPLLLIIEDHEILAAGFDGCMAKPLDVDQFVVEVRAVLERRAT